MARAQDVDAGFVTAKRGAGASWSAIARMAGCPEIDLRRRHDPRFGATDWASRPESPRPASPRDVVRAALRRAGLTADESLIIARLWLANGHRRRSLELAQGIAGGGAAQDVCIEAKRAAQRLGVEFVAGPQGLALSAKGVMALSNLAGLPRGPGR